MKEIVFEIDLRRGTGRCVYHEAVDLRQFGKLRLRRASHVIFRRKRQDFIVQFADGKRLGPYTRRETAISAEVKAIHRKLMGRRSPSRVRERQKP